jgi:hypothetical protein
MVPITFERNPLGSLSHQVKYSGGLSAVTLGDGYTSGWLSIRFVAGSQHSVFDGGIFPEQFEELLRHMMTADAKATVRAFSKILQELDVSNLVPSELQEIA